MKKKYHILSLSFLLCCVSASSFAQIIANGTYKILSSVHNEVMTCATTAPHDANMAQPNATNNYQLWTFTHQGNDTYKIMNVGNAKYLGINDGWCGNFGDAKANFTTNDANILLKVAATSTVGKYTFEIAFTTCNFGSVNAPIKAFDVQDGNAGAQIQTYEINNTNANQQFSIVDPATLANDTFLKSNSFAVTVDAEQNLHILSSSAMSDPLTVTVFEINGKKVHHSTRNNATNNETVIGLLGLSKGIYLVQITGSEGNKTVKKIIL